MSNTTLQNAEGIVGSALGAVASANATDSNGVTHAKHKSLLAISIVVICVGVGVLAFYLLAIHRRRRLRQRLTSSQIQSYQTTPYQTTGVGVYSGSMAAAAPEFEYGPPAYPPPALAPGSWGTQPHVYEPVPHDEGASGTPTTPGFRIPPTGSTATGITDPPAYKA
ncbi:hypothetical protein MNV49_002241 [Pseudohyphozyma bogoriensis]|nr:hypothetical protein MNV49_002241 [Pseudohyphozyma bogoriensis]